MSTHSSTLSRTGVLFLCALVGTAIAANACGDDDSGAGGGTASASTSGSTATQSVVATASSAASSGSAGGQGGQGGDAPATPTPPADPEEPWDTLAEWNLFADPVAQVPNDRVEPYRVIAALFSDEAVKLRFLYVPEGAAIHYEDDGPWGFPDGAILVKTFAYPEDAREEGGPLRLMETRLLWRIAGDWKTLTYVWNEDQTEAVRKSAGDSIDVSWIDANGDERSHEYEVPNQNQCKECHQNDDRLVTLGGRTLQMDLDEGGESQIDSFAALGFFDETPTPPADRTRLIDPFGDGDVILRARSYLHANCSHCHTTGGRAGQSGLLLDFADSDPEENPTNIGICKIPTSAGGATCGFTYDIVPGDPDSSVMICRVNTADPAVRMPPLARQLVHEDGVALLRELIEALPAVACE